MNESLLSDKRVQVIFVILILLLATIFVVLLNSDRETAAPVSPEGVLVYEVDGITVIDIQREASEEELEEIKTDVLQEFSLTEDSVRVETAFPYTEEGLEFLEGRTDPQHLEELGDLD